MTPRRTRRFFAESRSTGRRRFPRAGQLGTVLAIAGVTVAGGFAACSSPRGESDEGSGTPSTLEAEVLAHLGEHVILGTYQRFQTASLELDARVTAYQESGATGDLESARTAWQTSMREWQFAELMQVGPAGQMGLVTAGVDLRDQIYSYPFSVPCRVDQELIAESFRGADFATKSVNVGGLDALGYLLFHDGDSNDCDPNLTINTSGAWTAKVAELPALRAGYGAILSALVSGHASDLVQRWEPGSGNFLGELSQAGAGSKTYPSAHDGLSAIANALFYADTELKDMKIGKVAGLINCDAGTCPEAEEGRFVGLSTSHVRHNIEAIDLLFHGNARGTEARPGFDDLLIAIQQQALADEMSGHLATALAAALAIEEPSIAAAVTTDPESVKAVYEAIRAFLTPLETQVFGVLDLEITNPAGTDND